MKYLILLVLSIGLLLSCATGSFIITGNARPAIDKENVKIYFDPPSKYETIGIVEASSDVEIFSQAAQDRAIEELKKQAAKIGANGVILSNTGSQQSSTGYYSNGYYHSSSTQTKTAQGQAIWVIQE